MGNNPSANGQSNPYESFTKKSEVDIESLGRFEVFCDPATGRYFLRFESNYSIPNPELAESEITQMRKLDSIKNSCDLLDMSIGKSKVLCFDNYNITLSFEYYETSFETLIKAKTGKPDENEIWVILSDITSYLMEMSQLGLCHGDLQPKFILFNKNKVVKILCPLNFTTYSNAYRFRLSNGNYQSTYSPELLKEYENRIHTPNYDPIRADIFSMGISMLSYIHRRPFESFYDNDFNRVEFDRVRLALADLIKMNYSEELFYFLNYCLKESFYERATLDILLKLINQRKQSSNRNQYWQ